MYNRRERPKKTEKFQKTRNMFVMAYLSGFENWRTSRTYVRKPTFIGLRMILDVHTLTHFFSMVF